jgi:hypothetical protein
MASSPYRHPPPPFQAPVSGSIDQRLADLAAAINRKADAGLANTAVHFIGMIAPDGSTWRLYVDSSGALHTELVTRA